MNRSLMGRGLLILAILALSVYFFTPLEKKINLGLDLQGGMHLVLQVNTDDAVNSESASDLQRFAEQALEKGLTISPTRLSATQYQVTGLTPDAKDTLSPIARDYLANWQAAESGETVTYTMQPNYVANVRESAVNQALQTIRNRVDALGVAEPVITAAKGYRIVLQLPGVDDPERVRRIIKNTAFLEFRLVRSPAPAATPEALLASFGGQVPPNTEILESDIRDGDLEHAIALMRRHKAIEATLERARYYGQVARDALAIFRDCPPKKAMLDVVAFCVARAS